jgi:hypothetical protein
MIPLSELIFRQYNSTQEWPMKRETTIRVGIAALIYTMTNAVIFGAGLVTVLTFPGLRAGEAIWIPVAVVTSVILAAPAAWVIAPRLRARYWRRRTSRGSGERTSAHLMVKVLSRH